MSPAPDFNRSGVEAAMRGDLKTAEVHFRKAFSDNPDNSGILLNICRLMQMQHRHQELISFYEKNCKSPNKRESLPVQLRYMISKSAAIIENDKLIIELLTDVIGIEPQPVEITINLSEAYIRQGQLVQAQKILEYGLKKNARDPSLLTNLAIVESELGSYGKAEQLYKQIVANYPNQFLGHYNLGKFLAVLGRNPEARQCFKTCLNLVPGAPEARKALQSLDAGEKRSDQDGEENIVGRDACYQAIESKNWTHACDILKKGRPLIDPIRFQAVVTELPNEFQSEFGDPASYKPSQVVYQEQLIPANASIITDLIEEIRSEESLVWNRAGKPTRRGFQSHELFNFKASPTIQSLEKKLREACKNYLEKIPTLPINMNSKQFSISGWGVILKSGGYQKRHIHPEAKLSGVIYLSVPDQTSSAKTDEGNLLFSTKSPLSINPKTGLVVLFPSYLPHETIPQRSKTTERICIAFNLN